MDLEYLQDWKTRYLSLSIRQIRIRETVSG